VNKLTLLLIPVLLAAQTSVETILTNRVDESRRAMGLIIGTLDKEGVRKIAARGKAGAGIDRPLDGDTVFEIGSITKVFTSLLLSDMIERGEVKPDDPVSKYLPEGVTVPARGGKQITLLDLSQHVSALPRMPDQFKPADPENPYADYDAPKLYAFLGRVKLERDIGEKYEYSNLGVGLLGHALARRVEMSYEELLRRRILDPLEMKSTSITPSQDQRKRLALGHDPALKPVKNWDLDALAGAGAIRSTANDMLKFAAAHLGLVKTPLDAAMIRMRAARRPTGQDGLDIAMAWHILNKNGTDLYWHNGGTGGYRSFLGFDLDARRAVIVLCNTALGNDDVGFHLLDSRAPLATLKPAKERKEVTVDAKVLAADVGEFALAPTFTFTISTEEGKLFAQATNQPRAEIFAESETEFFYKIVDAQLTFKRDEEGKTTSLVLHQAGRDMPGARIK
jgi:D-alanyl-D-alanine-carboxypeptidase/D-alanyl-D-alanine-endopeptidase